jgi:hypothetical protein
VSKNGTVFAIVLMPRLDGRASGIPHTSTLHLPSNHEGRVLVCHRSHPVVRVGRIHAHGCHSMPPVGSHIHRRAGYPEYGRLTHRISTADAPLSRLLSDLFM